MKAVIIAILVLVCFGPILKLWFVSYLLNQHEKSANEGEKKIAEYCASHGINQSGVITLNETATGFHAKAIVDEENRILYITTSKCEYRFLTFPFDSIIGCEIFQNDQVVGGVKRAAVGGALFGAAGAVVGANTAKTQVVSYRFVIYLNDVSMASFVLNLPAGSAINESRDFAMRLTATIKAIVNENQSSASPNPEKIIDIPLDDVKTLEDHKPLSVRLKEIRDAKEAGLITEDEYQELRMKALQK